MNAADRAALDAKIVGARRADKVITTCVWSVAGVVVIYGLGVVYSFVTNHGVPTGIAWMLSPAVDAGLCLGLVATAILGRYEVAAGWVNALRWIAAFITLVLNIGEPLTHKGGIDWVGVGIHSVGPILLWVVVEAAASYQRKMATVIAELEGEMRAVDDNQQRQRADRAELSERAIRAEAELAELRRDSANHTETITQLTAELAATATANASLLGERDALTTAVGTLTQQLTVTQRAADTATAKLTTAMARTETVTPLTRQKAIQASDSGTSQVGGSKAATIGKLLTAYRANPAATYQELADEAQVSLTSANRYMREVRALAADSATTASDSASAPIQSLPPLLTLPLPEPRPAITAGVNGHSHTDQKDN